MQETHEQPATLAYATPVPAGGSGLAAGVWITLAGLALIFLGGCFCIGMLMSLNAGTGSSYNDMFIGLMVVLALFCFVAAAIVLFLGVRKLLRVGR